MESNINVSKEPNNYLNESPLHLAAANGQLDVVKYLMIQNINIEPRNKNGATPLHFATNSNQVSVVKYLFAHPGVNRYPKDNFDNTPLNDVEFNHTELHIEEFSEIFNWMSGIKN